MMRVEVLKEFHRGTLSAFLEKTGADQWGLYRVKSVRIEQFSSEEAAEAAYEKTIHPRLARETEKTTKPKKPQNRRRQPKNENR